MFDQSLRLSVSNRRELEIWNSPGGLTCRFLGRKEITTFFYIYMLLTIISLVLDAGVIPLGSGVYPYFVALQNGVSSALCTCLLVNGFVGFQLYEDGTTQSVWMLRGCSFAMFLVSGGVSILTFMGKLGLGPTNTIGLFVVVYLLSGICLLVYVVMQIILVVNTLQDRWPLGDITFGVFFFVTGQIILYVFSDTICDTAAHYLDGLFFATICNLLAVMMVYKVCAWQKLLHLHGRPVRSAAYARCYHLISPVHAIPRLTSFAPRLQYWDSITREDLEFSVGAKQGNWEVKELLPEDERRGSVFPDGNSSEYAQSTYPHSAHRTSAFGGGY